MPELKVAFIGWNQFQLIHVSELIKYMPNSVFILENKHNSLANFDTNLLNRPDIPIIPCSSKNIHKLDNLYDVIITQTVFTDIHKFTKAKIAMIQYGYAKEAHNYGPWRSLADICFTYGAYATKKIDHFCPTYEVGYLRQASVTDPLFLSTAKKRYSHLIKPNKKTILYLPTWGEYSSKGQYLDQIIAMNKKYNVLIKIHHNTDLLSLKKIKIKPTLQLLGANDDALQLIALSDIVISDYSGSIFDAIYCKKPVVLLDPRKMILQRGKVDQFSLEYTCRNKLGYVVNHPDLLEKQINKALRETKSKVSASLYEYLFSENKNTYKLIHKALIRLVIDKEPTLSQQQLYIRSAMKDLYSLKYSSIHYKFLNIFQTIYSKVIRKNKQNK